MTRRLIATIPPLCERGDDLQFLSPPEARHVVEYVYADGDSEIRVRFSCCGVLLGESVTPAPQVVPEGGE